MSKISEAFLFFRENNWRTLWAHLNARDTHPAIQFLKYAICGVGSLAVTSLIYWPLCAWGKFPALESAGLTNGVRALNVTYNKSIAFFFGNLFAYVSNSMWVFTTGRHHRVLEFIYFSAVSFTGFVVSLLAGPLLIKMYGISTFLSFLLEIVASVLVNYVCRKFFISKG